jgi:hypothetical protein
VEINVSDWQQHTVYDGVDPNHPTIRAFWKTVSAFTKQEKSALLRFATSCSRPPLMGFKHLQPPFCIRLLPVHGVEDPGFFRKLFKPSLKSKAALPTASTCFNMLKLPDYSSSDTLAEKLRQAITENTGFQLT